MKRYMNAALVVGATVAVASSLLHAQGRGGIEWTTGSYDAQRTASIKNDPRISVQTMQKPGEFGAFKFLWKLKLEYEPKAATALTQPILLDRIIGFRGFKSIASSERSQRPFTPSISIWAHRCGSITSTTRPARHRCSTSRVVVRADWSRRCRVRRRSRQWSPMAVAVADSAVEGDRAAALVSPARAPSLWQQLGSSVVAVPGGPSGPAVVRAHPEQRPDRPQQLQAIRRVVFLPALAARAAVADLVADRLCPATTRPTSSAVTDSCTP